MLHVFAEGKNWSGRNQDSKTLYEQSFRIMRKWGHAYTHVVIAVCKIIGKMLWFQL